MRYSIGLCCFLLASPTFAGFIPLNDDDRNTMIGTFEIDFEGTAIPSPISFAGIFEITTTPNVFCCNTAYGFATFSPGPVIFSFSAPVAGVGFETFHTGTAVHDKPAFLGAYSGPDATGDLLAFHVGQGPDGIPGTDLIFQGLWSDERVIRSVALGAGDDELAANFMQLTFFERPAQTTPEPTTLWLLLAGGAVMRGRLRFRRLARAAWPVKRH